MKVYFKQNNGITLLILVIVIVGALVATGATGAVIVSRNKINNNNSTENYKTNTSEEENKKENSIIEVRDKSKKEENLNQSNVTEKMESESIISSPSSVSTNSSVEKTLNGYNVIGKIEIPKTKVACSILEKVTKSSLETSVAVLYGSGLNKEGNTVIVGHNYQNGQFFSNNKMLEIGDIIYITDNDGNRLTYTIYDKLETTAEDTSTYTRNTNGAKEITLSSVTDDGQNRLIILAKADN